MVVDTESCDVYPLCDKCGQPVPPDNDATILDAIYRHMPEIVFFSNARHLFPINGCEGSPSRAQYLLGVPPDPRSKGPVEYSKALKMREAFDKMRGYSSISG